MSDMSADLLVGIDIGMSCSGVAYINMTSTNKIIRTFSWDGMGNEVKIPTKLSYPANDLHGNAQPSKWGFGCEDNDNEGNDKIAEWFKTCLDPAQVSESTKRKVTQAEAKRYYRDYLRLLYNELRGHFSPRVLGGKNWDTAAISFFFSVPTTWSDNTTNTFKELAKHAGFGSGRRFTVTASLSEPNAALAYALCEEEVIKNGETVLAIDAGGGTVDLCLLTVKDATKSEVSTVEVAPIRGDKFGATGIDSGFEELVKSRLAPLEQQELLTSALEAVAWEMRSSSGFQNRKKRFGVSSYKADEIFRMRVPCLKEPSMTEPSLRIYDGELEFKWSELESLFDIQINGIIGLIKKMMHEMDVARKVLRLNIDRVHLSGGLGRSRYVGDKLEQYISGCDHERLRKAVFHVSGEPQLCICRGLLQHARHDASGKTMFYHRLARASFGILSRRPHEEADDLGNSARAQGQITEGNNTGNKWANDYIFWFMKRGSEIPGKEYKFNHPFMMEFGRDSTSDERVVDVQLVTCSTDNPPAFRENGLVQIHTTMKVDLSDVKPVKKWYKFFAKKNRILVRFIVEATFGMTTVDFRCLNPATKVQISSPVSVEIEYEEKVARKDENKNRDRSNSGADLRLPICEISD